MKLEEGTNELFQSLRSKLPEPITMKGQRYIAPVTSYEFGVFDLALPSKFRTVEFESILAVTPGVVFQVWRCVDDGCIYF